MNSHEAKALAAKLIDAYPQVALRERTLDIYEEWLGDLDRATTEAVVDELIANSTTLPTVAEIRRNVMERAIELPTAAQAWVSLGERGREVHELAKEIAVMFGGTWGIRTSEEPGITRAQFLKAYEAAREQRLREANSAHFRRRRKRAA